MVSFVLYDLVLLVAFTLSVVIFLYTRKHNLKREGLIYLYRTQFGVRLIDWFGEKHKKWLKPLQYVVVACGYVLMVTIVYWLAKLSYSYLTSPYLAKQIKVPLVFPLIPYLPSLFKLDFLPPFYFTYWIIIIAIIAIPHEFSHGIFAKLNKIRIKSTGFGFLGPFLAAFVEQNDKDMTKKSKFAQLSVLAAGTFANVLTAILFLLVFWLFFAATFHPAGVNFSDYSNGIINVSSITAIGGVPIANFNASNLNSTQFVNVSIDNQTYYAYPSVLSQTLQQKIPYLAVYDDSPAFKAKLEGAITRFDGDKVTSYSQLREDILSHKPGDNVTVVTINESKEITTYHITIAGRNGAAFLGIGINQIPTSGLMGKVYVLVSVIKSPYVYYESGWGDFGMFIYNLLWWIIIVCISVALTNMLPMGIFDGGRFFMLTVWGITGNKKIGEQAFKWMTWIIIALVVVLMLKWVFVFF